MDEEIAGRINQEQPLPPAPKEDPSKNGTLADGSNDSNTADTSKDKADSDKATNETGLINGVESSANSAAGELDQKPIDFIEDKKPKYLEDVDTFQGPFQFNKSGTFVFNVKETKATEYVNFVKVRNSKSIIYRPWR